MSGSRTVTKGVRNDKQILPGHDDDNELLSKCANCQKVFHSEDGKHTRIVGKYPKQNNNGKGVDDAKDEDEEKGKRVTGQHENEEEKDADSSMDDCTVGVLEAMLTIFGLPLVMINGEGLDDGWWRSEEPCALCQNCHEVLSSLYKAFQEYVMLARETSYLSKCVKLLFENVGSSRIGPLSQGGKEGAMEVSASLVPRKRGRPNRQTLNEGNNLVSLPETAKDRNVGDGEDTDINWNLNVEINEDDEHLPCPSPSHRDWDHHLDTANVEFPESAEIPLGENKRASRASTKTKEERLDQGFEEIPIRSRRIAAKIAIKKLEKYLTKDDDVSKTAISKDKLEVTSELWDILSEGPMYYNEANLARTSDGKYICPETKCSKLFTGLLVLNRHTLSHDMDRPYRCAKCSKEFKTLGAIKLHVKNIHLKNISSQGTPKKKSSSQARLRSPGKSSKPLTADKTETFKCKHCEEHFLTERSLEKHLATTHLEATAQSRCAVCEQLFPTVASLARHLTSVHDKKHCCPHPDCYIKCATHSDLETHFENVHKRPMNLCKECGKSFLSPAYLHQHRISVHNLVAASIKEEATVNYDNMLLESSSLSVDENTVGEPGERLKSIELAISDKSSSGGPFKCHQCGKKFKRKHTLSVHILFHNETEPQFGCSRCPKKYFQAKGLRRHLLGHTMANPLACTECDKVFVRRDHLKRHKESVHSQNRPRKQRKRKEKKPNCCSVCHKTYSRKEYLSLHMRIHTGERPFMCSICGKTFRDQRNYSQHCITHKNDRPFCCSICGLTFKRAHHLHDHEGTHRDDVAKPFVCSILDCGKSFRLRKHLVSHELVHTGSRDHACHVCGKSFNRRDNLRQHINNVHGKGFATDMQKQLSQQNQSNSISTIAESSPSNKTSETNCSILKEEIKIYSEPGGGAAVFSGEVRIGSLAPTATVTQPDLSFTTL